MSRRAQGNMPAAITGLGMCWLLAARLSWTEPLVSSSWELPTVPLTAASASTVVGSKTLTRSETTATVLTTLVWRHRTPFPNPARSYSFGTGLDGFRGLASPQGLRESERNSSTFPPGTLPPVPKCSPPPGSACAPLRQEGTFPPRYGRSGSPGRSSPWRTWR